MNVDEEVQKLKEEITRLGEKLPDGSVTVRRHGIALTYGRRSK